jgi:hypothetical protein
MVNSDQLFRADSRTIGIRLATSKDKGATLFLSPGHVAPLFPSTEIHPPPGKARPLSRKRLMVTPGPSSRWSSKSPLDMAAPRSAAIV